MERGRVRESNTHVFEKEQKMTIVAAQEFGRLAFAVAHGDVSSTQMLLQSFTALTTPRNDASAHVHTSICTICLDPVDNVDKVSCKDGHALHAKCASQYKRSCLLNQKTATCPLRCGYEF